MIFFNGGPGHGFTEHFAEIEGYKYLLPDYNIVFMDQRGTGLSSKPKDNLYEYKYYSSRYISYDADLIRKKLLGNEKWIVLGQSFGGHLVRKYLELYGGNALMGISHGYGECSPITMKVEIEKQLYKQVKEYFGKYPEDKLIIEKIKSDLSDEDFLGTEFRKVYGKGVLDLFSFHFGIYQPEKIHEIIRDLDKSNLKEGFISEISGLGNLILGSTFLKSVVAYIDLIRGMSDKDIYERVEIELEKENINVNDQLFSLSRLSKNIVNISEASKELDEILERKVFDIDPINFSDLIEKLNNNSIYLHIFGGTNDPITPLKALKEEEEYIKNNFEDARIYFHFTSGNHREWREGHIFKDILD